MERYTTGEIVALVAPVMGMNADNITHVCVMISTNDGKLRIAGCEHQIGLILAGYDHVTQDAISFNTTTDNNASVNQASRKPRKGWLSRFLP